MEAHNSYTIFDLPVLPYLPWMPMTLAVSVMARHLCNILVVDAQDSAYVVMGISVMASYVGNISGMAYY